MTDDEIEKDPPALRVGYLGRVVLGLLLLVAGVLSALSSRFIDDELSRWAVVGGLSSVAAGLVPFVYAVVRRRDEFHRSLHAQACATALPVSFSTFAIAGVLQSTGLIPALSAFASMLVVLVTWGVSLVVCDRRSR
ncbi:MAG: hypothetical protein KUG77_23675 [Nannocystaceae bacterium]|nr:hypothetical protein [Nannocystaceae bacterium]